MTDHRWLELAAAYALGALDPEERVRFEAHLAECATCRAEVQALREVGGLLVYSAPAAAPPHGLRDRILSAGRQVRPIAAGGRPVLPWLAAAASVVLWPCTVSRLRPPGGPTSSGPSPRASP